MTPTIEVSLNQTDYIWWIIFAIFFSVVERAAQQLSVERWDQATRYPPPGRLAGGQPTENVDLREVFLRSDQNPLQEETPLFLHEQDERAQSLSGQDRKAGEP